MNATIKNIYFDSSSKVFVIAGICDKNYPYLYVKERAVGEDLILPTWLSIKLEWYDNTFTVKISLKDLDNMINGPSVWDLYITDGYDKVYLNIENLDNFEFTTGVSSSFLFDIIPYKTKDFYLAFNVKLRDLNISFEFLKESYNELELKCISPNNIDLNSLSILLKRRISKNLMCYEQSQDALQELHITGKGTFIINIEELYNERVPFNEDSWDAYVLIRWNNNKQIEFPLSVSKFSTEYKLLLKSSFFLAKFFTNNENSLGVYVKQRDIKLSVRNIEFGINTDISLDVSKDNNLHCEGLLIRLRKKHEFSYYKTNCFNDLIINDYKFNLRNILQNDYLEDGMVFDIYTQVHDIQTNFKILASLSLNVDTGKVQYQHIKKDLYAKPYVTTLGTLAIFIKKITKIDNYGSQFKLAVLGSCYSRAAFTSNDYFNIHYKQKYNIVCTQFHSSIVSIMSEPVNFPREYFIESNKLRAVDIDYIESDFKKDFFKRIDETKPDFLIIDFYADAVKSLILFNNGRYITGNNYLKENDNFLLHFKNEIQLINQNDPTFINIWKDAITRFSEEITKHIPENRIILQKARMTSKFYNRNGEICNYPTEKTKLVNRSNLFFESMESYFLKILPLAKVININDCGFLGNELHPVGNSPNHYESAYYKEFLKKLDSIIIEDFVSTKEVENKKGMKVFLKNWFAKG